MTAAAGRGGAWRDTGGPACRRGVRAALVTLGLALGLVACGGGSGSNPVSTTPTLTGVTVSPSSAVVPLNGTQAFTATATYSDGSTVPLTSGVTWASSAAGVLSVVSTTGVATGRAAGAATVSAAFGSVSGSASVTVQAAFVEVSLGREHALGVKEDGTLWAWGRNHWGQLGIGTSVDSSVPVRVGIGRTWSLVAVGDSHSLAIQTDGTLWAWGLNQNGQLGLGDFLPRYAPVKVGTVSSWAAVAAGDTHSVARQKDGKLFAWGRNHYGQLGQTDPVDQRAPKQVGSATNWDIITAAADHTLARRTDGTLWAWGRNDALQLGPSGADATVNQPTLIDFVEESWRWIAVSTGATHTLAVRSDGALFSWGSTGNGRLGRTAVGLTAPPDQVGSHLDWVKVSAGGTHSLAIRRDGTLWSWGANDRGQLGNGTVVQQDAPSAVGAGSAVAGLTWGELSAGFNASAALTSAFALWTWGDDVYGQLGVGGSGGAQRQHSPVKVN
jgi:alpha-tubulin suppressor-like RCC1 family protein